MLSEKYGDGIQTLSDLIIKFCSNTDSMLGLKHRYILKTSESPKVHFAKKSCGVFIEFSINFHKIGYNNAI